MVACLLKLRPQATEDQLCLRKFLSLHGLRLLWSWMVDSPEPDSVNVLQFREQVSMSIVSQVTLLCRERVGQNPFNVSCQEFLGVLIRLVTSMYMGRSLSSKSCLLHTPAGIMVTAIYFLTHPLCQMEV